MENTRNNAIIFIFLLILTVAALIYMTYDYSKEYSSQSNLEGMISSVRSEGLSVDNCIKNKKIFLYINEENPVKFLDSMQTVEYLSKIKIKNCYRDVDSCTEVGVKTFPSWTIEGKLYEKMLTKEELITYSGC